MNQSTKRGMPVARNVRRLPPAKGRRRSKPLGPLFLLIAGTMVGLAGAGIFLYWDYQRYSSGQGSRVFGRMYPEQEFHAGQMRLNEELIDLLKREAGVRNSDVSERKVQMEDARGHYQKLHWRISWRGGISLHELATRVESLAARDGWRLSARRIESRPWGEYLYAEIAVDSRVSHSLLVTIERRRLEPEEIVGQTAAVNNRPFRAAIVIDDVGNDLPLVQSFLTLSEPLTFSVIPYLPDSVTSADIIHRTGREVMVHMPMEPIDYPREDPGPGAILESMDPEDARAATLAAIQSVPYAIGMNNHMGSRVTTDPLLIGMVLRTLRERGFFFLDSRTTDRTIAYKMARKLGVPAVSRQVFLDDVWDTYYIDKMLEELFATARRDGSAIAIGHLHPVTLEALRASLWKADRYHVRICPISSLVPSSPQPGGASASGSTR